MRVRALDSNGDFTFGSSNGNYLTANAAVGQEIQTRVSSFLGNCFFDLGAGIDWFNLLSGSNQTALNLAVSTTILNTSMVLNLIQFNLDYIPSTRTITLGYQVLTAYSVYSGQFQVALTTNS